MISLPNIPSLEFNFVPISRLPEVAMGSLIDVIGICTWAGHVWTGIREGTDVEYKKRDVVLLDDSCTKVTVTLWGEQAENKQLDSRSKPVVAVRSVRVSNYYGLSLSMTQSGIVVVNPNIPDCEPLRNWYHNGGALQRTHWLSNGPRAARVQNKSPLTQGWDH